MRKITLPPALPIYTIPNFSAACIVTKIFGSELNKNQNKRFHELHYRCAVVLSGVWWIQPRGVPRGRLVPKPFAIEFESDDVIKSKFVKLWDLSKYFERTTSRIYRLRVVPFFLRDSRRRAKLERAWKSPHAIKPPFSRGVTFTRARVSLALPSLRKNRVHPRGLLLPAKN